ncbi:Sorbitol dehydrogenase [Neomoorella glycerini]|uniref:Sorbitol dehydrogenase n=1 Tax=Neomoorella glycerini TaxID=55779 RepID=A0A6I5ZMP0_9FIRM|nr:alcohol dehydrogenase catalytic domain-containing protein [Moorella glycerini]QGP91106.1 Sorbitol dehydrogenase [Moorella glycerini]
MALTYKAAVMTAAKTIEFWDVPLPEPGQDEVLIRVQAVGICTWEQRIYQNGKPDSYPFWGGHEIAGLVDKLGPSLRNNLQVGDHVAIARLTRCGECYFCRRGLDNLCLYAETPLPGQPKGPRGFSEYLLVRSYECYKIPTDLDFTQASLAEPVACCVRSLRQLDVAFGDTVVIQGAGIMGIIHTKLCKLRGATVIISEPDVSRREAALKAGADYALNPLEENPAQFIRQHINSHGAEIVIFTAGGQAAFQQAVQTVAPGGRIMLYGSMHPSGVVTIDANDLHYREYRLLGSSRHDKESFREAVALLASGTIKVDELVSKVLPFSEVQAGFQLALAGGLYRVVLRMDN